MTVAYIAFQQLTPATRDRASALLKLNPKYSAWQASLPPGTSVEDQDLMIFMIAATWPDQIKKDPSYTADGSDNGDRPDGPDASRNTGYDDMLMHKYWHFVDTPFTNERVALPAIPTPNAQTQIAVFRRVLASSSGDGLKSSDLSWLLHLVGDVHQPLHCTTRVSRADPGGDAGGNKVKLRCKGCPAELHAYWDEVLGKNNVLVEVVQFAKSLPQAPAALATKGDENDWIAEGFQAGQQTAYSPPILAGDGPFRLTKTYEDKALSLAKARVSLAGTRLANLLNSELKWSRKSWRLP